MICGNPTQPSLLGWRDSLALLGGYWVNRHGERFMVELKAVRRSGDEPLWRQGTPVAGPSSTPANSARPVSCPKATLSPHQRPNRYLLSGGLCDLGPFNRQLLRFGVYPHYRSSMFSERGGSKELLSRCGFESVNTLLSTYSISRISSLAFAGNRAGRGGCERSESARSRHVAVA